MRVGLGREGRTRNCRFKYSVPLSIARPTRSGGALARANPARQQMAALGRGRRGAKTNGFFQHPGILSNQPLYAPSPSADLRLL